MFKTFATHKAFLYICIKQNRKERSLHVAKHTVGW